MTAYIKRTVSRHMLRRTARAKAKRLNAAFTAFPFPYRVEKARRGPFGWRVVEVKTVDTRPHAPDAPGPVAEPGGLS